MTEVRWHRFRHYEGRWSNFDLIEECRKPSFCTGCNYKHPFCTEEGAVSLSPQATTGERQDG